MPTPGLLFIESNTTGSGMDMLERLRQARFPTTFLTRRRALYPAAASVSDQVTVIDIETNDIGALERHIEAGPPDRYFGVLTYSEYYVATCAALAARFGWRYLNPATAALCRDKGALRRHLASAGLPGPRFAVIGTMNALSRVTRDWPLPLVVKPLDESGSLGVHLARSKSELIALGAGILARTATARGQSAKPCLLVETYLEGPEYSVETVSLSRRDIRVIGITAKESGPPPHFVETGYAFPAALPETARETIVAAVRAVLQSIDYDWGFAHVELRLCAGVPVVIEVNPRLAGGKIPALIRLSTGLDLLDAALSLARGAAPALPAATAGAAAAQFVVAETTGRLRTVTGVDAARAVAGVVEVAFTKRAGDAIRPAESNLDRLGAVVATGASAELARATAAHAAAALSIGVEPQ